MEELTTVTCFSYLKSCVTKNGKSLVNEITRINKTRMAYARLMHLHCESATWLKLRGPIYCVAASSLLWGCEIRSLGAAEVRCLSDFVRRSLISISKTAWSDVAENADKKVVY